MFFWILGLILLFAAALCYGVVSAQNTRLSLASLQIRKNLWNRHNRIPLLINLIVPLDSTQKATFAHIVELRSKLSNEHISLKERLEHERRMSHLLRDIFIAAEGNGKNLGNTQLIALQNEFSTIHDECNRAINEYNYQLEKYLSMQRIPWFKIWKNNSMNNVNELLPAV